VAGSWHAITTATIRLGSMARIELEKTFGSLRCELRHSRLGENGRREAHCR